MFEKYDKLTVAKLAEATEQSYAMLLAKSKSPIDGEVYDSEVKNFAAIEKYLEKKEIDLTAIDFEALNEMAAKTTARSGKLKIANFEVGETFNVRYFKCKAEIVYVTAEYVCILLEGSTQPKVLAYSTFNACGITKAE